MIFTKNHLDYIVKNWTTKNTEELAEHFQCSDGTIYYWTKILRENGVDLPRKVRNNRAYIESVISEYLEENPNYKEHLNLGN